MPPKKGGTTAAASNKNPEGEQQRHKSPAEFFADNQAIAGFDNLGKSLYTSLRELVENSLDACESITQLPEIHVQIVEYTQKEFNAWRGWDMSHSPRKNAKVSEFVTETKKASINKTAKGKGSFATDTGEVDNEGGMKKKKNEEAYFLITVTDNGCGMAHAAIPELLGRVLSGSKYGVRQTRGKFGLGAKMALIWSKKSSGQPIRIKTGHRPTSAAAMPSHYSTCLLDIDIYKNEPDVLEHHRHVNQDGFVGTEVQVMIAGNWTTYKARVLQYLQQLAIITPYAILSLDYQNLSVPARNVRVLYDRRSEQMPPPAQTVQHHPASVNNLIIQQLMRQTKTTTMAKFLSTELSSVSHALAVRLVNELGWDENYGSAPQDLTNHQITRLVQLLRQVSLFKAPDASCLSPLGEYNLNLGIQKVLEPDYVATARDKAGSHEGHPFLVEAAVSLGGKDVKEGITVVRFANRIPLLFEGGADVATRVAHTKIKWANYKMDHKRDKIGVFVSLVSTKIPFKGTSKEYIGDDATEIQASVKRALQACCQQLRTHLTKRNALKDAQTRKSRLQKYVPDVSRALFGLLEGMGNRRRTASDNGSVPLAKRARLNAATDDDTDVVELLPSGQVTEARIHQALQETIDADGENQNDEAKTGSGGGNGTGGTERITLADLVRCTWCHCITWRTIPWTCARRRLCFDRWSPCRGAPSCRYCRWTTIYERHLKIYL